jgi:hypothetical protein
MEKLHQANEGNEDKTFYFFPDLTTMDSTDILTLWRRKNNAEASEFKGRVASPRRPRTAWRQHNTRDARFAGGAISTSKNFDRNAFNKVSNPFVTFACLV